LPGTVERIQVSLNLMTFLWLNLRYATVWISKPYVPVVLYYSGLYRSISVSDVHVTTLAGYAVNPQSPQSQVVLHRMKETRDLPRQQATTLSVVFGQHSAEPAVCRLDICNKSNQGGLFFQLRGSNCQVEGPSYLFDTLTIFLKVVFRNSQLIMEAFLVTKSLGCLHQCYKNSLYVRGMVL